MSAYLYTAGKNMTEHYHSKGTADENIESLDISTKSCQSDFATAIDVKNENFIAGEIKKTFPDHMVSSLRFNIYCRIITAQYGI